MDIIAQKNVDCVLFDCLHLLYHFKHVGFLYFEKYSYAYEAGKELVIIDNTNISNRLKTDFKVSLIIILVFEIINFIIAKILTRWIIKPVIESFNKQKDFIADASHELKTPLSVIIASSEALEDNPKEKKWLKNIQSEADRMNILITDLLQLAKSEYHENKTYTNLNLSKIIELAVLTFEGKTFENDLKLDYKIESNIYMNLEENSIKQLVEILLDNAIKHANAKSLIEVFLTQTDKEIKLEVKNKGEGIKKGEEEKIFERFYRGDKSRNRNDNRFGLGLSIAKNIVLNHQGLITAKSEKGFTTFKVVFKK